MFHFQQQFSPLTLSNGILCAVWCHLCGCLDPNDFFNYKSWGVLVVVMVQWPPATAPPGQFQGPVVKSCSSHLSGPIWYSFHPCIPAPSSLRQLSQLSQPSQFTSWSRACCSEAPLRGLKCFKSTYVPLHHSSFVHPSLPSHV